MTSLQFHIFCSPNHANIDEGPKQNKYERCEYFFIIGKLIIFHDFLRHEVFRNSQWFARYRGLIYREVNYSRTYTVAR